MTPDITRVSKTELILCGGHTAEQCSEMFLAGLPSTKQAVVRNALNHLFDAPHFSICKIDSLLDVLGRSKNTPAYKQLKALHCMNYMDMGNDLKSLLPGLVTEALQGNKSDIGDQIADKIFNEVTIAELLLQKNGDMTAAAVWLAPEITGLSDWMRPLLDLWNDCRHMERLKHAPLFGFIEQLMCDIYLAGVQAQLAKAGEAAAVDNTHPLPSPPLEGDREAQVSSVYRTERKTCQN